MTTPTRHRTVTTRGRTCVGCGKVAPRADLVRCVREGETVAVDLPGRRAGRGTWVHPVATCLQKAARSGFSRGFKSRITANAAVLAGELVAASNARITNLLTSGVRHRTVAEGLRDDGDTVVLPWDEGDVSKSPAIAAYVRRGRAVVVGSRSEGHEVSVVLDGVLGAAVRRARDFREGVRPLVTGSEVCWSPEVR
ncbi:MAG: YlxR family protein [Polyangiaceae bacterium]|nr:YlxR family protein [Polyangiaceae bacterium]